MLGHCADTESSYCMHKNFGQRQRCDRSPGGAAIGHQQTKSNNFQPTRELDPPASISPSSHRFSCKGSCLPASHWSICRRVSGCSNQFTVYPSELTLDGWGKSNFGLSQNLGPWLDCRHYTCRNYKSPIRGFRCTAIIKTRQLLKFILSSIHSWICTNAVQKGGLC